MSLLARPAVESRTVTTMDYWGHGYDAPRTRAESFVPAFAAVRTLADAVASAPIDTYRVVNGRRETINSPDFLVDPSDRTGLFGWLWQMVYSAAWHGNAYGHVTAWSGLYPRKIEWLNPATVQVDTSRLRPEYRVNGVAYDRTSIVHLSRYLRPGAAVGIIPVVQFARALGLGVEAERFGFEWFQGGGHPTAVLSSDQRLDEEQAKTIKARVLAVMRNNREPLVLGAGLKYDRAQATAAEAAFLETHQHGVREASRIWGVPPELIAGDSGGNSITYANVEQRLIGFNQLTVRPWATLIEQLLTSLVPRPQFVKLNLDASVRVDMKTRTEVEVARVQAGLTTPDEERRHEDLAPLPNGVGAIPNWPPSRGQGKEMK